MIEKKKIRVVSHKMNSTIGGLSHIGYNLLKINSCIAKAYKQSVYCCDHFIAILIVKIKRRLDYFTTKT